MNCSQFLCSLLLSSKNVNSSFIDLDRICKLFPFCKEIEIYNNIYAPRKSLFISRDYLLEVTNCLSALDAQCALQKLQIIHVEQQECDSDDNVKKLEGIQNLLDSVNDQIKKSTKFIASCGGYENDWMEYQKYGIMEITFSRC
eukprot:209763_1